MKETLLINGKYSPDDYREMLDKQSGIPGLPGMIVHEPTKQDQVQLERMRHLNPSAHFELVLSASLVDGMVELVPKVVLPPFRRREDFV